MLIGVAQAFVDKVAAGAADIEADNFGDMMTQMITNRFRDSRERRLFIVFLNEARLNADVRRYYVQEGIFRIISETEKRLAQLIEAGIMRPVDPVVAARTLSATVVGFAALLELGDEMWRGLPEVEGSDSLSPERLGAQLADIFLNGLNQPPLE